jgi:hypothetical protein
MQNDPAGHTREDTATVPSPPSVVTAPAGQKNPAVQFGPGASAPADGQYLPAGHIRQSLCASAPVNGWYVPFAHWGTVAPVPVGQ